MEHENSARSQDNPKPVFVAELTPHRSLGRTGFLLLMGFVATTCLVSGILFLVMGAWPVFVFMGLDVLIVFLAFKLNYRDGRKRERVCVSRNSLKVQQYDPAGNVKEHLFNPYWTRFEVDRHEEHGILNMRLASRDANVVIGSFLNPDDRASFARALGYALADIRR